MAAVDQRHEANGANYSGEARERYWGVP